MSMSCLGIAVFFGVMGYIAMKQPAEYRNDFASGAFIATALIMTALSFRYA